MGRKQGRLKALLLFVVGVFCVTRSFVVYGQESLGSYEDLYYDYLSLIGKETRPYLNYKTLSDNAWKSPKAWRVYGPDLFLSYNSAKPYGYNDGALWQGRGVNVSLTGGARFQSSLFEATLKPQLVYSQNEAFRLLPSFYPSSYGYIWGYGFGVGADAPQRFGNDPVFNFNWGDSELRYTDNSFTLGVGYQSPWIGPGRINAIMHSNNAPPYPKIDLGFRKTPLIIWGTYVGEIEARLWGGYLSESKFFDTDDSNNHNLISALSVAFAPAFAPGLTFFVNRSYLAPWKLDSGKSFLNLFIVNPSGGGAQDEWDQRGSLGFDYLLSSVGFEVYGELGINDYGPSLDGYVRYPFHSMVYTVGLRKAFASSFWGSTGGEILLECTNLEISQDFQFQWPATFYMHHQIAQGYTNEGQWLGAGIGTGGNSQYLGARVYFPWGYGELFIQRVNPDNDFLYRLTIGTLNDDTVSKRIKDFRADLTFGGRLVRFYSESLLLRLGLLFTIINNPYYDSISWNKTQKEYNLRFECGIVYKI